MAFDLHRWRDNRLNWSGPTLFVALAISRVGAAEPVGPNPFGFVGEGLVGEEVRVTWPVVTLAGALQTGPAGAGILTAGVTWGTVSTGLFKAKSLHRVVLHARAAGSADGAEVAADLTFGHTWEKVIGLSLDGGVATRFWQGAAVGPVVVVRPYLVEPRGLGLYLGSWFYVAPDREWGVAGGISFDFWAAFGMRAGDDP